MSGRSYPESDAKFRLPAAMVLSGPSSSGKTTFLAKFLDHYEELIDPVPTDILYCYGHFNELVPVLHRKGITTCEGVPNEETLRGCQRPLLLILDDLMLTVSQEFLDDMFTKKSHHESIFVVLVAQSLFDKKLRVARTNAQYIVLMKAPNAALNIRTLGSQLFPGQLKYFLDAYRQATSENYGYLLIDMHASTPSALRLRSDIFPGNLQVVFSP